MILGFNKRFVNPIMLGTKVHTIREDKTGRWKAGNSIQLATGVRTKNYEQFNKGECVSTQLIEIVYHELIDPGEGILVEVKVDGKLLNLAQVIQLSNNDGFESYSDFLDWFDKDFTGKIIHWTDLKY